MSEQFSRTELLIGEEGVAKLSGARVAVFGIGGVGGYVCEALVRSGVGAFDLIDSDTVSISNLNRQIIATRKTIGRYKVDVMKERMQEINPEVDVRVYKCFFLPENVSEFPFEEYDYIVDAVDTVTAKLELISIAKEKNIPVISAMGAGNKLNPERFRVADVFETNICPLARVMRRELKKRNIKSLKVVYSDEEPVHLDNAMCMEASDEEYVERKSDNENNNASDDGTKSRKRAVPGSIAYVPAVSGLIMAGEIVKDLVGHKKI